MSWRSLLDAFSGAMNSAFRCGFNLLLSGLIMLSGCNQSEDRQTAPGTKPAAAIYQAANSAAKPPEGTLTPLESLAAPVALYPDPLLAELLIASTYPAEIERAARRLETDAAQEAADNLGLDASVLRLAALPPVIIMMHEHPQWTAALGNAFLATPDALLAAIQALRRQAMQSGVLKNSAAQKVTEQSIFAAPAAMPPALIAAKKTASAAAHAIIILPADARKIQMPLYDAEKVFNTALARQPEIAGDPAAAEQPEAVADYYPAYFPSSEEPEESGGALVFAGGALVQDLITWGEIEWRSGQGFYVTHAYGGVTNCRDSEHCWLFSDDYGFGYSDELRFSADASADGADIASLAAGPAKVWRHDPRHRRGLPYPVAAESLRNYIGSPLAGQHYVTQTQSWWVRGYNVLPAVQAGDDAEEELASVANYMGTGDINSLFSGITIAETPGAAELKRGIASRTRDITAAMQSKVVPEPRRGANKPVAIAAAQAENSRESAQQRQRSEDFLPGIFSGSGDNVQFTVLYSRRGADSRAAKMQPEARTAVSGTKSRPEEAE